MIKKITEKTTIKEILENKEAEKILIKHNLPCLSCPLSRFEIGELKIGEVCRLYGIDLKSLLDELNKFKT